MHFYAIDAAVGDHDGFDACIHQITIHIQQSLDFRIVEGGVPSVCEIAPFTCAVIYISIGEEMLSTGKNTAVNKPF